MKNVNIKMFNLINKTLVLSFLVCLSLFCKSQNMVKSPIVPDSVIYQMHNLLQDAILSYKIVNLDSIKFKKYLNEFSEAYNYASDKAGLIYFLRDKIDKNKISDYHLIFDSIKYLNFDKSDFALIVYKSEDLKFTNYPKYTYPTNETIRRHYAQFKYDTIIIKNELDNINDKIFILERNLNSSTNKVSPYLVLAGNANLDLLDFFINHWNRKSDLLSKIDVKQFVFYRTAIYDLKNIEEVFPYQINFDSTKYYGFTAHCKKVSHMQVVVLAPKKMKLMNEEGLSLYYYTNDTNVTKSKDILATKVVYKFESNNRKMKQINPKFENYTDKNKIRELWLKKDIVGDIMEYYDNEKLVIPVERKIEKKQPKGMKKKK